MHPEVASVARVVDKLNALLGDAPPVAITLGSGLGPVEDRCEVIARVPVADLGLPVSTVVGHAGEVVRGRLGKTEVVLFSGRIHLYEGYSPGEVVRYVRALHEWGVEKLVLTCSAGSLHAHVKPGALVLITDHINLMGMNPLVGPVLSGTRFPSLEGAYDQQIRDGLHRSAAQLGIRLHEGIYAAMLGPAYETPAEIRLLQVLGADLVGMSTVPEVLAAARIGMTTAGVAVVSNLGTGITDETVDHSAVTEVAGRAAVNLASVFEGWLS